MPILKLISEPASVTSHWLKERFNGEATVAEFVKDFSQNHVTHSGRHVPAKNVYSRILRDERRKLVVRKT